MKVQIYAKPKNHPIIIEGFPGFGLVGTIVTEFLIKHLNAKPIGYIWSEELLPIAAIHESKIVEPIGIYYDKRYNLVILHSLSAVRNLEWQISDILLKLCKELKCKELISIEGIGSHEEKLRTYYVTSDEKKKKKLNSIGIEPLKEGWIIGVTGALLLKNKNKLPMSCFFVESHLSFADSMAAAKIIELLDKYLGLKVDYKPLMKAAEQVETKIKTLLEKAKTADVRGKKEETSYIG